jgi:paraquat-inducible protein A
MDVSSSGIVRDARLTTGPEALEQGGLWELSLLVLFTTLMAPVIYIGGTALVLCLRQLPTLPRYTLRLFGLTRRLRQWSMIEVFLVGIFVAYTKLREMAHIEVGAALWALIALMILTAAIEASINPELIWEDLARKRGGRPVVTRQAWPSDPVSCETCFFLADAASDDACPRCLASLHRRKPNSINRTWAFTLAATMMYLPANIYPVLTYITLGSGSPSTILGGAKELLDDNEYLLAAIVVFASVIVPLTKLVGLFGMLIATRYGSRLALPGRTRFYRVIEVIGRWSMIDVFMESILVALVHFGGLISIEPGVGALAFAAVVILTMFAAESFDPRLMWDAAEDRHGRPGAVREIAS